MVTRVETLRATADKPSALTTLMTGISELQVSKKRSMNLQTSAGMPAESACLR
ncbi:MAG: hypothetical protein IAE89_09090 [Anaerolineae bacterium]|nr:hypothetical protein [Anaerolineae bacterium]